MNYEKVFVTNITKDTNIDMGCGVWLHHVICDEVIENGKTEKQVYRIFSNKEYEDVINKGYYEIEDNPVKEENIKNYFQYVGSNMNIINLKKIEELTKDIEILDPHGEYSKK